MNKNLARKLLYGFILLNIAALWYFSYTDHPSFSIEMIQQFLEGQNMFIALVIYTLLMILRGLTIFPGTPMMFLAAILFPTLYAVIAIEIAVQCYILIIYKYSELLDFKIPNKIMLYEERVKKYGIPYIMAICLIPGMSMNILAYFLSALKVPLKTQMIGIGLGSIISIFVYLSAFEKLFELST